MAVGNAEPDVVLANAVAQRKMRGRSGTRFHAALDQRRGCLRRNFQVLHIGAEMPLLVEYDKLSPCVACHRILLVNENRRCVACENEYLKKRIEQLEMELSACYRAKSRLFFANSQLKEKLQNIL